MDTLDGKSVEVRELICGCCLSRSVNCCAPVVLESELLISGMGHRSGAGEHGHLGE